MFFLRKGPDKVLKDAVETVLGFSGRQFWDGRLRADDKFDFRNGIDDNLTVGA